MRHVRFEHGGGIREGLLEDLRENARPVFLQPGDEVEVEVGDLGVLSNPVGAYVDAELHHATTEE